MNNFESCSENFDDGDNAHLFDTIAQDINENGYSINPNALPSGLVNRLWDHAQKIPASKFNKAGVGRDSARTINSAIRSDEVSWINSESEVGQAWLDWAASLQEFLNRRLFLGLFSFESHFARYGEGDFYKKHQDSFIGQSNRILSLVVYLNPDWPASDGGELVIYTGENHEDSIKVTPGFGTLVVFLSEEFPHEVLAAKRDRYSIAGWFRLNSTNMDRVDPPE